MFLNITVYGYSKDSQVHAYSEGLEEIVKYASEKIEEIADILESDIPEKQALTANRIMFIVQVILIIITAAFVIVYCVWERSNIRQKTIDAFTNIYNTLCGWVRRRQTAVKE